MFLDAALRDLEHSDPRVRAQATDALGRVDDGDRGTAVTALVRAVEDAHPSVRYAALLSLGELGAGEAVDAILARLGDGEPLVREAAAIALGQLGESGGARAWSALERALASDEPEVRFQAVASLAELDAARAASLVVGLLDDGDAKVRAQAAAALGDAGDRRHADRIARLLDEPGDVRHEAAMALARLGDRRAMPTLTAALTTADRALDAATALAALGLGDDAAARAAVAHEVERFFGDALVKVRAAEALARAGDARGLEHLRKAARSRRDDVRGLAQSVLSELGDAAPSDR
jgi:HEAT repeat protein